MRHRVARSFRRLLVAGALAGALCAIAAAPAGALAAPSATTKATQAAALQAPPVAAAVTTISIDGRRAGPVFEGIGAISGGGGNSRLLIDYPPRQRPRS